MHCGSVLGMVRHNGRVLVMGRRGNVRQQVLCVSGNGSFVIREIDGRAFGILVGWDLANLNMSRRGVSHIDKVAAASRPVELGDLVFVAIGSVAHHLGDVEACLCFVKLAFE